MKNRKVQSTFLVVPQPSFDSATYQKLLDVALSGAGINAFSRAVKEAFPELIYYGEELIGYSTTPSGCIYLKVTKS